MNDKLEHDRVSALSLGAVPGLPESEVFAKSNAGSRYLILIGKG